MYKYFTLISSSFYKVASSIEWFCYHTVTNKIVLVLKICSFRSKILTIYSIDIKFSLTSKSSHTITWLGSNKYQWSIDTWNTLCKYTSPVATLMDIQLDNSFNNFIWTHISSTQLSTLLKSRDSVRWWYF